MKLSIIVPVYNMAADGKLNYCLDSLVAQTVSDYEIIAVDDCSTDNSLEILKEYEKKYSDKFIAVHSPVNKHQGGAKNIGLKMAKGEWIGFIDSDDWIVPDFYERLIAKAEETGADIVGCDYCLTDEHSMKVGQIVPNNKLEQTGILDDEKRKSLILDGGSLVVKIFKRKMILENELFFPEDIFYEDNALGNSYLVLANRFEYIPEPLYYYYQHNTSTVHVITEERCVHRLKSMRYMLDMAKEDGSLEQYRDEIEFRFTNLFYQNTVFSYMQGVKRVRVGFLRTVSKEMKETFPNFQENKYYLERVNSEERKFLSLLQKSAVAFVCYYKFVYLVRRIKKWLKRSRNY